MAQKISRRKLAAYVADRLATGKDGRPVFRELAAYLIDSHREREYELVARDIETALLERGTAIATVLSARKLSTDAKRAIEQLITSEYDNVKHIHLREVIDEQVLGGVKLSLPDRQLDATALAKLEKLGA